jgi:DNA ligase D-like protein (predicted polymerase)/DNA ligase D-like protein (predicted 3'-phosphoesterase)
MSLKEYRRKRNFKSTPEPDFKARSSVKAGKGNLTFVIQKHDASRTHYDFRLELKGVLKSWAVPKGPSLTSQDPRLAIQVEDHPLAYGSFEGVIPKGNYGAGTVMIWDSGEYIERGSKGRRDSTKAIQEGIQKGHITFILNGEKLQGEFALVRLQKKGAPDNGWLLIKKHDEYASRQDVTKLDRSVSSGRTMQEIAAQSQEQGDVWLPGKGRRKKVAKAPVRETRSMPRKIRVMQPVSVSKAPEGSDWIFESVGEGLRAVAEVDKSTVRLYSKMFLSFDRKYPSVVAALRTLGVQAVFDGEILREGKDSVYRIHDLLYLNGKDLRGEPLEKRKEILSKLDVSEPLRLAEFSKKVSGAHTVAKRANSSYESKISRDWLKFPGAAKAERSQPESDKPPLTHLSKIFWPKEGYTKGNIVDYYDSVADYILPHLKDRPESLHRQPNGIQDPGFFHKDMTGFLPRRISRVNVYSESVKKTLHYFVCNDKWALLYLINMGCIELNPWLSRTESMEKPDYVVIDLDPDENPFDDVIRVAKGVKKVLDSIGVKSYCKTSGGTGLHICIPTGAKYDYETCRLFAEDICKIVQRMFPKFTSLDRSPGKRRKKIYLDFLQNRRGQTLAAPYCVRPRPRAPVSTPLEWSEVKAGLKPEDFTIKNILKRLKRVGDLWAPLLTESENIPKAHLLLKKRSL